jgi:hypothetical protein
MDSELQQLLQHAARQTAGGVPAGPVQGFGPAPAALPEGVYGAHDLLQQEGPGVPFPMPGGKQVYVHPVTPDEVIWLNSLAAREVERLRLQSEPEADLNVKIRARVYQVIACCRVGAEFGAAPVFQAIHAEAVRRNLPYPLIEAICARSDRLGIQEDLGRRAVRFFGSRMGHWLATWSSRSSEDWEATCRDALARCASSVSSLKTPEELLTLELPALPAPPMEPLATEPEE